MKQIKKWHYSKFRDLDGRTGEFYNNNEPKCGVYVIYSGNEAVYVGSGEVIKRLQDHQDKREFDRYPNLMVAYAFVQKDYRDVETFLAYMFRPKVGEKFPRQGIKDIDLPEYIKPKEEINSNRDIEDMKKLCFLKSQLGV